MLAVNRYSFAVKRLYKIFFTKLEVKIYSIFSGAKIVDVRNGSFIFPQPQPVETKKDKARDYIFPRVAFIKKERAIKDTTEKSGDTDISVAAFATRIYQHMTDNVVLVMTYAAIISPSNCHLTPLLTDT